MNIRLFFNLPSDNLKKKQKVAASLALLCAMTFHGKLAQSAEKYMIWYPGYKFGTTAIHSPDWNITFNWTDDPDDPTVYDVPAAGDYAFILNGYQAIYNFQYPNDSPLGNGPLGSLSIDNNSSLLQTSPYNLRISGDLIVGGIDDTGRYAPNGAYYQNGGNLDVGGWIIIGGSGTGSFTQGGNVTLSGGSADLYIGQNTGSNGTYNLGAGALDTGWQYVGWRGNGTFLQIGGSNTARHELNVGTEDGSHGTYTLRDGKLDVGIDTNAQEDHGIFIGRAANSHGFFTQEGGAISTYNLFVGNEGSGTFTQTGGTNTIFGMKLLLGGGAASTGQYSLSGNGVITAPEIIVGAEGQGTFTQNETDTTVSTATLALGYNSGGSGTYTLDNGSLTAENERIGMDGTGTFTQNGGTNTVTTKLVIGQGEDSSGSYTINGGTLNAERVWVGAGGTGTFNQGGGNVIVGTDLLLGGVFDNGNNILPGHGTYTMTGGTLTVTSDLIVGNRHEGTFNQEGGTINVSRALDIARHPGSTGTFNFSGGNLNADIINHVGGTVNLSGDGTRVINGDVTNEGTFKVTDTTVSYTGTFINSGAYISDPSTNKFTNLTVQGAGYLKGGDGDVFQIYGSFLNYSSNPGAWDTQYADLLFSGTGLHDFQMGPAGFVFDWKSLTLDDGVQLNLRGGALRVDSLLGFDPGDLLGFGTIYFDFKNESNAYLRSSYVDGVIRLGAPGPVPEPATMVLLGTGLVGLWGLRRRRVR